MVEGFCEEGQAFGVHRGAANLFAARHEHDCFKTVGVEARAFEKCLARGIDRVEQW